jgi:uncharacterized membrane protein
VPDFKQIAEIVSLAVDGTGVLIIVLGLVIASVRFALPRAYRASDAYRQYRQNLGKAILLGLEFLVAGDIIRTVAVDPTLQSVLVLGLIVLIRTFLSLSLEVELEGRFPWQGGAAPDRPKPEP